MARTDRAVRGRHRGLLPCTTARPAAIIGDACRPYRRAVFRPARLVTDRPARGGGWVFPTAERAASGNSDACCVLVAWDVRNLDRSSRPGRAGGPAAGAGG